MNPLQRDTGVAAASQPNMDKYFGKELYHETQN